MQSLNVETSRLLGGYYLGGNTSQILYAGSLLLLPVNSHLPIHRNCYVLPTLYIPELHDLVPFTRQLSPSARLLRVLLNRFILPPIRLEPRRPQPVPARLPDRHRLPCHLDRKISHQLLRDRPQHRLIQASPPLAALPGVSRYFDAASSYRSLQNPNTSIHPHAPEFGLNHSPVEPLAFSPVSATIPCRVQ